MRSAAFITLSLLSVSTAPSNAAQDYPNQPVRVLVPMPAGSTPDLAARLVTPGLSAHFGHQFIVDNRSGEGGVIGTELASRATADGYTLLVGTPGTLTIMQHVQKDVPYDTLKDFAPIGLIAVGPYLFVAHPSVKAASVAELVRLAKASPGKLTHSSAGNGSTNHLAMALFENMAGVDVRHVPYKDSALAITDLLAGHVDLSMLPIAPLLAHVKAKRLRVLAVTSARRSSQLPQVPTVDESGVKGFEAITWSGLLAPAKTPKQIVSDLGTALQKVVRSQETRMQFERQGAEPAERDAAAFGALLRMEIERYGKLTSSARVKLD